MADKDFEVSLRINLDAGNLAGQLSGQLGALKGQYTGLDSEITKVQKSLSGAGAAQENFARNLSTTRYALYDVSSSLAAVSAAALALPVASTMVAMRWEADFAQVIRTSQLTGDSINNMRDDLIDLVQTMPASWADITDIATLAGQLGVAEDRVASFTQTVVKFSAVSDTSATAAATAFGRLDALLPDVQGQYEKLGSSIAKVAVESVATESQIIAISTQISSMGAFAGLTADEVVGLSGALASVGTQPELSRGTVTRLFTNMSRAVSDGGRDLENFARVAGVSSETFANAFGTDKFGPIFQAFIEGLADVNRNGGDAVATLSELGVTSVRDVPALLRLAGAGDLLAKSLDNARTGFSSGTELSKQYGVIATTTAARVQILQNNFQALLATIGQSTSGPLNALIAGFTDILKLLTDIAANPVAQVFIAIGVAISTLIGNIAQLGVGITAGYAGIIAMQQALVGLGVATVGGRIGLSGLIAQLLATGTAGTVAARGLQLAVLAMKGLGIAAAALVGIQVAAWLSDLEYAMKGLPSDLPKGISELKEIFASGELSPNRLITEIDAASGSMSRFFAGLDSGNVKLIRNVDEAIAQMANSGNIAEATNQFLALRASWRDAGGDQAAFNALFVDSERAIREAGATAAAQEGSFSSLNANIDSTAQSAEEAKAALDELKAAIEGVGSTAIAQERALIAQSAAMNALTEAASVADATLDGTNQASLNLRSALIDAEEASRDAAQALIDNGESADVATEAYRVGRKAIEDTMIARGMDAGAARAWATRVLGSADTAEKAIRDYAAQVKRVPQNANTTLTHNARGAGEGLSQYIRRIDSIPRYVSTSVVTHYYSTGTPQVIRNPATYRYASGGSVWGPGTGTSDSIPAWLSNGEYVMNARAHSFYGSAFMNAINSLKAPKFAQGGPVGTPGTSLSGVVELGPKSLGRMGDGNVTVNVLLDDEAVSRAAQRGDQKRRVSGDYHA